jgi:hypothetical protein
VSIAQDHALERVSSREDGQELEAVSWDYVACLHVTERRLRVGLRAGGGQKLAAFALLGGGGC